MTPGEELAERIRQYVATQVGPELVRIVTEASCRAVATLMQDPSFTDHLLIVAQLRQENQWLKSQVIQLQRTLGLLATGSASSGSVSAYQSQGRRQPSPPPEFRATPHARPRQRSSRARARPGGDSVRMRLAHRCFGQPLHRGGVLSFAVCLILPPPCLEVTGRRGATGLRTTPLTGGSFLSSAVTACAR